MLKKLLQHNIVRDAIIICAGCLVFAVGFDCFEAKNGLAAGGATGLSLVIQQVVEVATGATIPIGLQVLVMNALLLIPVFRTGGLRYAARTVLGVIFSAFFTDALAPVLPNLGNGDLLLCALWGGVVTGLGLGLVFRVGGNTGGTDILAQLLAKHTPLTNGVAMFMVDGLVVAVSVPVFGLENALYALVAMYLCSYVIDRVVDGMNSQRCAYIISDHYRRIADAVMNDLDRGCTELHARGSWTGDDRAVLMVVLSRSETAMLKELVAHIDPDAIVFISEVYEAFGEGFRNLRA
ncbi:MAG: YitT family protein [Atopobiaceae bacterium]